MLDVALLHDSLTGGVGVPILQTDKAVAGYTFSTLGDIADYFDMTQEQLSRYLLPSHHSGYVINPWYYLAQNNALGKMCMPKNGFSVSPLSSTGKQANYACTTTTHTDIKASCESGQRQFGTPYLGFGILTSTNAYYATFCNNEYLTVPPTTNASVLSGIPNVRQNSFAVSGSVGNEQYCFSGFTATTVTEDGDYTYGTLAVQNAGCKFVPYVEFLTPESPDYTTGAENYLATAGVSRGITMPFIKGWNSDGLVTGGYLMFVLPSSWNGAWQNTSDVPAVGSDYLLDLNQALPYAEIVGTFEINQTQIDATTDAGGSVDPENPDITPSEPGTLPGTTSGGSTASDSSEFAGDSVGFPDTPYIPWVNTGGVATIYTAASNIKTLFGIYNTTNVVEKLKASMYGDLTSLILNVGWLPVAAANVHTRLASWDVATTWWDWGDYRVNEVITSHFEVFLGDVYIPKPHDSFLDTLQVNVSLYLPFYGTVSLSPFDTIGKTISIKYIVEFATGDARIFVLSTQGQTSQLIGDYNTNVLVSLPIAFISQSKPLEYLGAAAATVGLAVTGVGLVGAGVAAAGSASIGAAGSIAKDALNLGAQAQGTAPIFQAQDLKKSDLAAGGLGVMGSPQAYIIVERPEADFDNGFGHNVGFRYQHIETVGNLKGYTKFQNVVLDGINCLEAERAEILSLLQGGVYL